MTKDKEPDLDEATFEQIMAKPKRETTYHVYNGMELDLAVLECMSAIKARGFEQMEDRKFTYNAKNVARWLQMGMEWDIDIRSIGRSLSRLEFPAVGKKANVVHYTFANVDYATKEATLRKAINDIKRKDK